MKFEKTNNGFVKHDENGKLIAEITYATTSDPNVVVADLSLIHILLHMFHVKHNSI